MIRKERGELVCECTECDRREFGGTLDFRQFVDDLKDKGWKIRNNGGDWEHFCPECVAEIADA